MEFLKTMFLVLMIIVPLFFIYILLTSKNTKKNTKYRNNLIKMIIASFLINACIYGGLMYLDKDDTPNNPNTNETANKNNTNNPSDNKDNNVDNENNNTSNENNNGGETGTTNDKPNTTNNNQNNNNQNNNNNNTSDKPVTNTTSKGKTSKGYEITEVDGVTYIDGFLIANKTYPLPQSYVPKNTHKAATSETGACQECIDETSFEAYMNMKNDAKKENLTLWIASGYRSYNYQKVLYNNYISRSGKEAADTFSARPGHSEHQSGFAFDLNSVTDAFASTKEGIWVNQNCYKYGFIIRYPKGKEEETGYKYESWHLRYVGTELASKLYNNGDWITLEDYFGITSKYAE